MARNFYFFYGNGKIDRYPPLKELKVEKILIFTEKTLKILKREFAEFQKLFLKHPKKTRKDQPILRIPNNETSQKAKKRIYHDYQPSHIWATRDSSYWQWRRVKEWFNQYNQDNKPEITLQQILRSYQAIPDVHLDGDRSSTGF